MHPEDLHYTKQHEWVRLSADVGAVGITDYAQKQLGDVVYVDLPRMGAKVEQGKVMGSVESVKAVSDLYSPVSGEVIEINDALATAPEKLNESPHCDGWLVKIRLSAPAEIQGLLAAADYEKYVAEETGDGPVNAVK
jgi:glycine cleavage system H protein